MSMKESYKQGDVDAKRSLRPLLKEEGKKRIFDKFADYKSRIGDFISERWGSTIGYISNLGESIDAKWISSKYDAYADIVFIFAAAELYFHGYKEESAWVVSVQFWLKIIIKNWPTWVEDFKKCDRTIIALLMVGSFILLMNFLHFSRGYFM